MSNARHAAARRPRHVRRIPLDAPRIILGALALMVLAVLIASPGMTQPASPAPARSGQSAEGP